MRIEKPAGIVCWYKPGNFAGAGIFQFCHWEPILVYGKGRIGGPDVFKCSITRQTGLDGHPSPKPAKLFSEIITRTKAETILDPFLGSGTTLAVAKALGKRVVSIEIEERYCRMTVGRLLRTSLSSYTTGESLPIDNAEETLDNDTNNTSENNTICRPFP